VNTEKTKGRRKTAKSSAFDFGPMGHGMSEMMAKCCAGQGGSFPDCLAMMEEMRKQCCAPNKNVAESGRKKK
jgi:pentatricopeptide repeat protein